jgi:hypothetical protein
MTRTSLNPSCYVKTDDPPSHFFRKKRMWQRGFVIDQFLPVASNRTPDHPMLRSDSLREQRDSPAKGLVHRYPEKTLSLTLDVCPAYCRFCTRSYAIGQNTGSVENQVLEPVLNAGNRCLPILPQDRNSKILLHPV